MRQRLVIFSFLLMPIYACATDAGHGHVRLHGNILDTACAIAVGDRNQTINLGTVTISEVLHKKPEAAVSFRIHLINCTLQRADAYRTHQAPWKNFHITFVSNHIDGNAFANEGNASGEGIIIRDDEGHQAISGEPLPDRKLTPGSMTLNYKIYLSANRIHIKPGKFQATIGYLMDYD